MVLSRHFDRGRHVLRPCTPGGGGCGAGAPLALRRVDLSQELGVGHNGAEWQEARDNEQYGGLLRPLVVELPESGEADIKNPEYSVRHADDAHELRMSENVFQWHGHSEQQEERDGFHNADAAQAVECGVEFEHGI